MIEEVEGGVLFVFWSCLLFYEKKWFAGLKRELGGNTKPLLPETGTPEVKRSLPLKGLRGGRFPWWLSGFILGRRREWLNGKLDREDFEDYRARISRHLQGRKETENSKVRGPRATEERAHCVANLQGQERRLLNAQCPEQCPGLKWC